MSASYYAIIPADVRYDKGLNANAKLLYGEITALCNEKGYCWATNRYFADLYSTTERTIQRWIKNLIDKKYINAEYIYKENSKEIEQRKLIICGDKNVTTPGQECHEGNDKNVAMGNDNNVVDNNTLLNNINNIFTYWNDNKIIVHKKVTKDMEKAYKKAIADYSEEDIKTSITNYSKILKDDKYFFKYKWGLDEFLSRGIKKFLDWEVCSSNFTKEQSKVAAKEIEQKQSAGAYKEWRGRKSLSS